jgi:MFS transporter, MHS family, citrate/tricarballylate:H+ symporter
VTFYLITVYTPTFGRNVLKLSAEDSLLVTLCVAVTNFLWLPIGGAISDRVGRKAVLLTIAVLAFVTAYPALAWLVAAPTFPKMLVVELLFSFYFGVYNGAMVAALSELVPRNVRATGFSLAFSLAAALFGTATPAVSTFLIDQTGDKASPGFWLMFAGLCGIVSTLILYRSAAPAPARVPASA